MEVGQYCTPLPRVGTWVSRTRYPTGRCNKAIHAAGADAIPERRIERPMKYLSPTPASWAIDWLIVILEITKWGSMCAEGPRIEILSFKQAVWPSPLGQDFEAGG